MRLALLLLCVLVPACGARQDPTATLARLRDAISAEVTDANVREDHNRIVEDVAGSGALEGMFQHEIQSSIGRGQECGASELCADHDFRPTDWMYDVGHAPGDPSLPAGPTLIVGFDSTGRCDRTYYRSRH